MNTVAPGHVVTDMLESALGDPAVRRAGTAAGGGLRGSLTGGGSLTGAVLPVDGGHTLWWAEADRGKEPRKVTNSSYGLLII